MNMNGSGGWRGGGGNRGRGGGHPRGFNNKQPRPLQGNQPLGLSQTPPFHSSQMYPSPGLQRNPMSFQRQTYGQYPLYPQPWPSQPFPAYPTQQYPYPSPYQQPQYAQHPPRYSTPRQQPAAPPPQNAYGYTMSSTAYSLPAHHYRPIPAAERPDLSEEELRFKLEQEAGKLKPGYVKRLYNKTLLRGWGGLMCVVGCRLRGRI